MKEELKELDIFNENEKNDDPHAALVQATYLELLEWFRVRSLSAEVSVDVLASLLGRVMFYIEHEGKVSIRKQTFSGISRLIDVYHLDATSPKGSA